MELKESRNKLGITQRQIADELHCSEKAIIKIEKGEYSDSLTQKYKEYISRKIFDKNLLKISVAIDMFDCINSINLSFSKEKRIHTFKVSTSLKIAEITFVEFEERFVVTHKPIKGEIEEIKSETKTAYNICRVLNNLLKEQ